MWVFQELKIENKIYPKFTSVYIVIYKFALCTMKINMNSNLTIIDKNLEFQVLQVIFNHISMYVQVLCRKILEYAPLYVKVPSFASCANSFHHA